MEQRPAGAAGPEGSRAVRSGLLRQDRSWAGIGPWAAASMAGGPRACLLLGHMCLVGP